LTLTYPPVPGVAEAMRRRASARRSTRLYPAVYWLGGIIFVGAAVALVVSVADGSASAFAHTGLGFVWSGTWNPEAGNYGAGILVVGTLVTTAVAMVLAVPIGLGVAVALAEMAPRRLAAPVGAAVEFLAAVPSIVVGLWALLILEPVFASTVEPFLGGLPGLHWLFGGPALGSSLLLAAVVLAVMTLPTIVALSRSALAAVPRADREAAMALGATRWQVVRTSVLPAARSGIAAAVTLALGRALGESIAVALVIGNRPQIPHSLLAPGATLGSAIVNQFAEASPGLQTSSVIGLGAVLLILTVAVNAGGQAILRRGRRAETLPPRGPVASGDPGAQTHAARADRAGTDRAWPDRSGPSVRETAARTVGRRLLAARGAEALCALAVVVALVPLAALLWFTISKGAGAISASFLTHGPTPPGVPGGGISTAITGSARTVGLGLLMAVPVGLSTAVLLYERRGRVAAAIRFGADVLTGVPSILIGIFAFTVLVEPLHRSSTVAAAFALAVLMVPIMIRADEESLRAVAPDLWEAGMALGASRPSVVRRIVLRQALPGVIAGNLLALARGGGETAPLLFTLAAPTSALTWLIFDQATQVYPSAQRTAWGAALALLVMVLLLSGVARALAWYLTRKAR
jgi:phosphate transport system permease protein